MAPTTLEWLWAAGWVVSPDHFQDRVGYFVLDDHIPLLKAKVPCVDLIDFDYAYWHTLADTPDKLSATSLQVVGDVLISLLYPDPDSRPLFGRPFHPRSGPSGSKPRPVGHSTPPGRKPLRPPG